MLRQQAKQQIDTLIKEFKQTIANESITLPSFVKIVEVGPRDGLQNESQFVPSADKISLINSLTESGLQSIEVTSFVSPKWIPQLADNQQVYTGITKANHISYPVLVPNLKGLEQAMAVGVKEIAVFSAASESFTKKNTNCSIKDSLDRFSKLAVLAHSNNIKIRGYVSCVMGCPYEGDIDPQQVNYVAQRLLDLGCYEVSLGDTIGSGTIHKTIALMEAVTCLDTTNMAVHLHDTNNTALANMLECLKRGVRVVDASIGGLGGCPYAKKANGNVSTENVIYVLDALNIAHGVDREKIKQIGMDITDKLERTNMSFL